MLDSLEGKDEDTSDQNLKKKPENKTTFLTSSCWRKETKTRREEEKENPRTRNPRRENSGTNRSKNGEYFLCSK